MAFGTLGNAKGIATAGATSSVPSPATPALPSAVWPSSQSSARTAARAQSCQGLTGGGYIKRHTHSTACLIGGGVGVTRALVSGGAQRFCEATYPCLPGVRPVISPSKIVGASSVCWVRESTPAMPSPVKETTQRAILVDQRGWHRFIGHPISLITEHSFHSTFSLSRIPSTRSHSRPWR